MRRWQMTHKISYFYLHQEIDGEWKYWVKRKIVQLSITIELLSGFDTTEEAQDEVDRLKVGIGRSQNEDTADYVLSDFNSKELEVLSETISLTVSACQDWINKGNDYVMRNYNRRL